MAWQEQFPRGKQPDSAHISAYISSPLWEGLCGWLEETYAVQPRIEYSTCSGAPGWNVKYRKSGRSLCTLYPRESYYTCLISIGGKEAMEAELVLSACTAFLRELYGRTKPFNGSRWLMIDVTSPDILEDVKHLISLRVKPKK